MKRSIITGVLLLGVASVLAQGTINYNNRQSDVRAPVYGPLGPGDTTQITGQSSIGIPAGTTDYGGRPLLAGAGYYAQLWAGPANSPEGSLAPVPGTLTTFRTGGFAGYFAPPPEAITIPGVPQGSVATLQLRVWENLGGTVSDWATAEARWLNVCLLLASLPCSSLCLSVAGSTCLRTLSASRASTSTTSPSRARWRCWAWVRWA